MQGSPEKFQSANPQPTMKGNMDGDKTQSLGQTPGTAFPAYVGLSGPFPQL